MPNLLWILETFLLHEVGVLCGYSFVRLIKSLRKFSNFVANSRKNSLTNSVRNWWIFRHLYLEFLKLAIEKIFRFVELNFYGVTRDCKFCCNFIILIWILSKSCYHNFSFFLFEQMQDRIFFSKYICNNCFFVEYYERMKNKKIYQLR